jgi:hypothetical protein
LIQINAFPDDMREAALRTCSDAVRSKAHL